jgi:hypothetical protein
VISCSIPNEAPLLSNSVETFDDAAASYTAEHAKIPDELAPAFFTSLVTLSLPRGVPLPA